MLESYRDQPEMNLMALTSTASVSPISYQLAIEVDHPLELAVGSLGICRFPAGHYVYTGSAVKNIDQRIGRHLRHEKRPRWHIDYLLMAAGVNVTHVSKSALPECLLNQQTAGLILIQRFGASDCKHACGSHLKYQPGIDNGIAPANRVS